MTPPRYEELALEVTITRELAQLPGPPTNHQLTLCLACGAALAGCGCADGKRTEAVALLHAELAEGRDPAPALERWRAERHDWPRGQSNDR